MLLRGLALLLLICGLATVARADELRPGYLELTQQGASSWQMVWKAPIRGGLASQARPVLPPFCTAKPVRRELVAGALVEVTALTCTKPLPGHSIGLSGLDATVTDALVRVAPLGRPVQAARLTSDQPMVALLERPERLQVAGTYARLGVGHILFGFDHLLFVLALVLLLRDGWLLAKTVTAFTIAHSITLIGTALGYLSLPRAPVESVIALSIMFLAVEVVKLKPGQPRLSEQIPWVVAFAFGLLHGFGFAGALAEIGMPESEVPTALLCFNLGVEAGQLLIVAGALVVLTAIRRLAPSATRPTRTAAAYAIGAIASYWFIERTLG